MKFKPLPLAAGLVALSMGAASAAPATVVQDLHLRAGRSTGTPVIGILPGGTTVDASNCGGGWCAIDSAEGSGYASSRYLDIAGGYGGLVYGGPVYSGPVYAAEPPVYAGPGFGVWGPGIGFGFGGGHRGWHHHGGHHHWH
jgi:uncharacterized protein YraI